MPSCALYKVVFMFADSLPDCGTGARGVYIDGAITWKARGVWGRVPSSRSYKLRFIELSITVCVVLVFEFDCLAMLYRFFASLKAKPRPSFGLVFL